jgi:hypothetical protein
VNAPPASLVDRRPLNARRGEIGAARDDACAPARHQRKRNPIRRGAERRSEGAQSVGEKSPLRRRAGKDGTQAAAGIQAPRKIGKFMLRIFRKMTRMAGERVAEMQLANSHIVPNGKAIEKKAR